MLSGPKSTIRRARDLRRTMSLPEVLLWQELRKRPDGLKFHRQQSAGALVGDFYCYSAKLLVEIDGEAHPRGNAPEWSERCNQVMANQGIPVLRIAARKVSDNMKGVLALVVLVGNEGITSPPCSVWSPSSQGEDF